MLTLTLDVGVWSSAFSAPGADERELREFVRANLEHLKPPHSVTFVKNVPNAATGRLQKYI